ncbi:MAG: DUF4870 domain-containing protein [Gracilimonas sp.]|uniref:helix-turn-helix domain-containing protein n=1 Tax=Gracilimonas sp. TaxID=1974203 RepID=UPI0019B32F35|nr:helix-turn-helix domain-containing protein [Gracilimonas sp.]MBD3616081.1 DUF4870 domain-containing protein [Gracilimonas sp.]
MSNSLANQIKNIRNQKGFSQELLAEKTGLSLRTIQRVENAETEPRGDTLLRIAVALQVTPDELLEWNQVKDVSTLIVLNLSALSFLFYPILGVIVPLIIWVTRKDAVKGVNELGKKLLNFQITFVGVVYLIHAIFFIIPIFRINLMWLIDPIYLLPIPFFLMPILIYAIPYIFNFGYVLLNTFRIKAEKEIDYKPSIKIIR